MELSSARIITGFYPGVLMVLPEYGIVEPESLLFHLWNMNLGSKELSLVRMEVGF